MNDIYVGSIFHNLTVIDTTRVPVGNYSYKVLCRCKCGTEKLIEVRALRSGHTKSCGCLRLEKSKINLSEKLGLVFGKLTIIGNGGKEKHWKWECKCECGNIIYAGLFELESGKISSCGCKRFSDRLENMQSLIGQRFNKVVITGIDDESKSTVFYKCDCGNIKSTEYYNFKFGRISSCGCIKSKGEYIVG